MSLQLRSQRIRTLKKNTDINTGRLAITYPPPIAIDNSLPIPVPTQPQDSQGYYQEWSTDCHSGLCY